MRWEVLGCRVEDRSPSGSPAGRAAVGGVAVALRRMEAKPEAGVEGDATHKPEPGEAARRCACRDPCLA